MAFKVSSSEQGIPSRFSVKGLPSHRAVFELDGVACEIELSLNGEYIRTPSKAYNMVASSTARVSAEGFQVLGYQVIFWHEKSSAEFQVFKFHESPAISEQDLEKLNVTHTEFNLLTNEYPRCVSKALDAYMLPNGVAKFLLQAKKCTSS